MKGNVTVPAAPFRRLIEEECEHWELREVAHKAGLSERIAYRIRKDAEVIEFDTADKIVTRLRGPMYWHEDEELSAIYVAVDLRKLDFAAPTSDVTKEERNQLFRDAYNEYGSYPKAAKALDVHPDTIYRSLGRRRAPKVMTKPICKRGHDKRVTGITAGGACLICRRERRRMAKAAA